MKFIFDSVKELKWFEKLIWLISVFVILLSFMMTGNQSVMSLVASLIGVTALIFVAKGNVIGQVMTVIFGLFYAIVSIEFHYWSEVITYLGMTSPIAVAAVITWIKNPFQRGEVRVRAMRRKDWIILLILTAVVTFGFYFILKALHTPNLFFSTVSIATSFMASMLVMLRSEFYGIFYGLNDVVLIILWILATVRDIKYLPMIFCFVVFLLNDLYGFFNWQKMKLRQRDEIRKNSDKS